SDVLHKSGSELFSGLKYSVDGYNQVTIGNGILETIDNNGGQVLIQGNRIGFSEAGAPLTYLYASYDVGGDEVLLELPHENGKIAIMQDIVHLSGNQDIYGNKAFQNLLQAKNRATVTNA